MKTKLLTVLIALITFPAISQLIISSNTTWTTNQVLTQSVIVQQGATLTINPGVQVQVLFIDNNSDLIGDVKLEIKGSLNVAGDACNKVNFLPFVTTSNKQYWTGIEIDTLATNCTISNATVQNALIGIKIENNSLNVNGVEVINSKLQGINAIGTNSSISVSNSVIRGSDGEGISVSNATAFSINNSKVRFNGTSGLSLSSVSSSTISNSVIYSNGKSGLFLLSTTTNVNNSVIRKNTRMGILSSNSNLTCQYSDIDSNSVDGLFIGGNSTLNMTNSSISNNQGFGVETSEYIFNTDFGNIVLTGSAPSINLTTSNFINNHNSSITLSSSQFENLIPINGYIIGTNASVPCGTNANNSCNNVNAISWDESCLGQGLNPNPATSWYTYVTFHIPFGMFSGFNGLIGINPTSNAWSTRPKYAISNISSPQSPFWEWSYNATNTFNPLSSYSSGCYPINAGTYTLSDKIGFMAAHGGSVNNSTNGYTKYSISQFYFTFGGYNYRSLNNNTSVTDILTGNYWDTIVPTAVTNSVGAVLNLNGFVISEILASHSNLSNSFIYSNASTFQLQQNSTPFCTGNTNYLIAPGGSYNYQWFNNGAPITNNNDSLLVTSNGTYSVQVSGSCAISSSPSTINIQSGNPITIASSGATSFCAGNTVTLTSPSPTGNLWSNGATTQSIVVNSSGNYGLTVTSPQSCPSIAVPIQVNVTALPSPPVISNSSSTTFCENGSVFLTSNLPGNLLWSNGSTLQSISVNTSGTYSCQITSNGCTSLPSNTIQVNVIPNPISTLTPSGPTTFCQGNSVVLNAPISAGNTYQWFNNGIAIPGEVTNFYNATTTGNYSVFVTNNSCSSSSSPIGVVSNPIPQTPIITASGNTSICQGNSVTLNSNVQGTIWSNGSTNQSIIVNQSGIYTAQASNNGCLSASSNAVSVAVNPLPTVNAGNDQTVCSGTAVTLSGNGANTYSWNNSVSNGVAFIPAATTTYTVTGTNTATGCTNTDQVVVNVNPLPTVNAGNDQTVCAGTAVTLSGNGANTYSWNNSVSNGVAFTPLATTTYTVTGTNTATGCTNTDQVLVNVNALPTVNAGNDQTVCAGTAVTLSGTGANTYSWNNSVSNGVAFTPISTATYTVTGTDANNCTNTDQVVVNVNALPAVNAGNDQTVCSGTAVTLSGSGANTYSWNNSVSNGVAFTPGSTATYTVTGTDANNCSSTDQVTVTVNPLPTVNAGNDQTVCSGTAVTLSGTGANTYSWNNSVSNGVAFTPASTTTYTVTGTNTATGCTNTDQVLVNVNALPTVNAGNDQTVCAGTAVTLSGTGANTYSWNNSVSNGVAFTPISTATYTVTGTDANNCTNTDQVTVTVNPLPTVNAGNDQTVCSGTAVTLSGSGANTYSWNNSVSNGVAFTPASTTTYTVTGTDVNGCVNTDDVTVNVNDTSFSTLNESALDSYTLNGQTYTQSGSYTQVLTNASGCDSTITLNLTLSFTGINESEDVSTFRIFPNPTRDVVFIEFAAERTDVYILMDASGRKVQMGTLNGKTTSISLKDLSTGTYMLQVGADTVPIRLVKE